MIGNGRCNFFTVGYPIHLFLSVKKIKRPWIFFLTFFNLQFSIFNCFASDNVINLNSGWKFRKTGDTMWLPANVPGTIHTDLLGNEIIPDPFYGANEKKLQWIDSCNWEYQVYFNSQQKWLEFNHVELVFEGIDTYAKIYLNDSLILSANNMFRTWKVECKKILKKKNNHLLIQFESAVKRGNELAANLSYTLPGEEKMFSRKAAYHYGWDWGPRFVTCGIWRPVKITGWNDFKIESIQIIQHELSDSLAQLTARLEINTDHNGSVNLFMKNHSDNKFQLMKVEKLIRGKHVVDVPFSIRNPKRWWSNGLGDPFLYQYTFAIGVQNELSDEIQVQFGLRTIELIQKEDSAGKSFYFELNGVPVFMKGANYIPADHFLPRVTKENYERIILSAKDANMNMLRVWGGGVYEDDQFYNLCDKNGILVWQDFMFACAMYPGDSGFVENVKQEAIDNVKRLRNHPSIALWCGNNEVDEGWHNWGWQKQYHLSEKDSAKIWNDYVRLFHSIIPGVLDSLLPAADKKVKGNTFYWPSSPSIGWGKKESLRQGDSHYWGVWWGMEPFDVYNKKVGRFMSEYGFQGMPGMNAVNKFCDKNDVSFQSEAMKNHQKHPTGFETIQTYLEREFAQPKDFKQYVYVSQLLQAKGIRIAIEAHRRTKPYCMGTLYWQLNDCWPVVSWSSTDYFGEWKALHYEVKKAFQDVLISPFIENGKLKIQVVNDRMENVIGTVQMNAMDFGGVPKWNESKSVVLNKNSSQEIFSMDTSQLMRTISKETDLLYVVLLVENKPIAHAVFYLASSNQLRLTKPNYAVHLNAINRKQLEINADVLAKNVCISIPGKAIKFSDNYFDMLPGKKYLIWSLDGELTNDDVNKIDVKSLIDTYQ